MGDPIPGMGGEDTTEKWKISDEEANQILESISPGAKEILQNPAFMRYLLGNLLFRRYFFEFLLKKEEPGSDSSKSKKQRLDEESQAFQMFVGLAKGGRLYDAVRSYQGAKKCRFLGTLPNQLHDLR